MATPDVVVRVEPLRFPWQTIDPFLFCVHHDDRYPAGNEHMGPAGSLEGRTIGQDFEGKDGWRMYHGDVVPGFPQHPHRGFETVTVTRNGFIDHSDSVGATARYGGGDVQWLTAGKGILHAEMFPLVARTEPNPLELFQIWLNLPAEDKFVDPYFAMFWREDVPRRTLRDEAGKATELTVVAGRFADALGPPPPKNSWAARTKSDVAIWTLKLEAGATFVLPAAAEGTRRMVYFFAGSTLTIDGRAIPPRSAVEVVGAADATLQAGAQEVEILMLQGRPIGEPVVQYGPFVMNTRREIEQAFEDYRRTEFGGWKWPQNDPVHSREEGRFARRPDGVEERPRKV